MAETFRQETDQIADSAKTTFRQANDQVSTKKKSDSIIDELGLQTAGPFFKGVAGLLDFPITIANLAASGIHAADKKIADTLFGGFTGAEQPR